MTNENDSQTSMRKKPQAINKNRQWQRQGYQVQMVFKCDEEIQIIGSTRDVSLSGVFFVPDHPNFERPIRGQQGVLELTMSGETHIFPCQVIRCSAEGIALNLHGKQAFFGMVLTHGIFKEVMDKPRSGGSS
ncbi:MAG: PilZ domain-containing protein [Magnetococcus sp. DMHC-6]